MARIIGGICTSHVPAIGNAIARGQQNEPYWRPFFDGFKPAHDWLKAEKPDAAVVIYNDHGLNFFLDKMPTFAVGAAREYLNADEGWGLPVQAPYPGDPDLSWHIIESLVADEFDLTTCQEMKVDHGFVNPMALLWPGQQHAIPTVPVTVNTVQHPLPSPHRCFELGKAIGRAVESYEKDIKVLVIGTGGLSHQLDGTRAGFINKPFDLMCLEKLVDDPEALTHYTVREIVEQAGSQGIELLMWIAMRGAMTGKVTHVHSNYHIPISNTAAGLLVLDNEPLGGPVSARENAELMALTTP
ncbi:MAG: class III extradiol dioxygenase family protein [Caulobacteraceae bacterium]